MRIPQTPPDPYKLIEQFSPKTQRAVYLYRDKSSSYYHWDEIRHRPAPNDFSTEQWWTALKFFRLGLRQDLPFADNKGLPLGYTVPLWLQEQLHYVDQQAGGSITSSSPEALGNKEEQQRYLISSLMEEAITSSQLEGAATTLLVAKEMLRTNRAPRDLSERMISNNYFAMKMIEEFEGDPLSPELLLGFHKTLTENTLKESNQVGRFRNPGEEADVVDFEGNSLHRGVAPAHIEKEIAKLCAFANEENQGIQFIHPVVRAIILHFWLAWLHPFCDGNGRTARALFYWSLQRSGYWLFKYISISEIIRKAPAKYVRAFLYTETDENDVTYFIHYHMGVILQALEQFHQHAQKSQQRIQAVDYSLRNSQINFNYRQLALLSNAIRHPNARYTFKSHATSHKISIPTARTDLNSLADLGFLNKRIVSQTHVYSPVEGLQEKLKALGEGDV